jgi:hypothetical protein
MVSNDSDSNGTALVTNSSIIRTMVRGVYDLQKVRIQMGNRITGNFKAKLGQEPGTSEKELEKQAKKVLTLLRASYDRITDGIVEAGGKLPSAKKFKGDELISTYTELVLVDQYMGLLRNEERHFRKLQSILVGIPIYDTFLSKIVGCGPAMSGVIISEFDICKAEYSSSLWKYAGLDVVTIGKFTDEGGKDRTIPAAQIEDLVATIGLDISIPIQIDGKTVTLTQVGRSKKEFCLVDRTYKNKKGNEAVRKSITFNPFLKTKLLGVLGTSFLRSVKCFVDSIQLNSVKRLALAKSLGFVEAVEIVDGSSEESDIVADEEDTASLQVREQVINFLREKGHKVTIDAGPYGQAYYDYKNRLINHPKHKDKSEGHRHNMANRYMIKRFLVDLYAAWRPLEGLPVAKEYSEAKLGIIHKKAT